MGKTEREKVMTGVDSRGEPIWQPRNSFYADEYWEGVASGSIVPREEPMITGEVDGED